MITVRDIYKTNDIDMLFKVVYKYNLNKHFIDSDTYEEL